MIYKRFAANLRAQNWSAIAIELAIVIVGVFIGTQVSNWNDERIEQAETVQVLRGLEPELRNVIANMKIVSDYFDVTRKFGDTAFAGWRGDPGVSDRDFVIAAYQASQIIYLGVDNASWSEIFGGDRLRTLGNQDLRDKLAVLMTADFAAMDREISTDYRRNVRKIIPEDIQDAIRARCGDRRVGPAFIGLPPTCTIDLPDDRFASAAADLRAHPELVGELRWHFAAVAGYVENVENTARLARETLPLLAKAR